MNDPNWKPGDPIICRFCKSDHCEHGDHCSNCGCPQCGFPGAYHEHRGFCSDCDWEAVPGARKVWHEANPVTGQDMESFRAALGLPADVVGRPLFPDPFEG
jgi:hypothetical protein